MIASYLNTRPAAGENPAAGFILEYSIAKCGFM